MLMNYCISSLAHNFVLNIFTEKLKTNFLPFFSENKIIHAMLKKIQKLQKKKYLITLYLIEK